KMENIWIQTSILIKMSIPQTDMFETQCFPLASWAMPEFLFFNIIVGNQADVHFNFTFFYILYVIFIQPDLLATLWAFRVPLADIPTNYHTAGVTIGGFHSAAVFKIPKTYPLIELLGL